ncbi:hypothetical protein B7R22_16945 [Subtercola boreus]|uniref:Uncharacterized protein n=1 Tax=Subtercola boreus TaxID=120213 RepID=A0A3E0VRP4_9MICO|nr:hypothetical protein [Subtercola boreus]RFA12118.1 hypothetical protein B7R22_16945 [Subtercola boreus]
MTFVQPARVEQRRIVAELREFNRLAKSTGIDRVQNSPVAGLLFGTVLAAPFWGFLIGIVVAVVVVGAGR